MPKYASSDFRLCAMARHQALAEAKQARHLAMHRAPAERTLCQNSSAAKQFGQA